MILVVIVSFNDAVKTIFINKKIIDSSGFGTVIVEFEVNSLTTRPPPLEYPHFTILIVVHNVQSPNSVTFPH